MKTVQELRDWLDNKPGGAIVEVLIEHGQCQYQFEANDFAFSEKRNTVIIMHEKWDGKNEATP